MSKTIGFLILGFILATASGCEDSGQTTMNTGAHPHLAGFGVASRATGKLAVIWYSDDAAVAERACLMYTHTAKTSEWFDQVKLVIWGPSQQLLVDNSALQTKVQQMIADGVIVEACLACANLYGIASQLEALGITVKYMGSPLTDMLKTDWATLTF